MADVEMLATDCHNVLKNFHKILTNANLSLFLLSLQNCFAKAYGNCLVMTVFLICIGAMMHSVIHVCFIYFMFVTCNLVLLFFHCCGLKQ